MSTSADMIQCVFINVPNGCVICCCCVAQGETSASHDVTSNVERSKHLDQGQEKKLYDAEVSAAPDVRSTCLKGCGFVTNRYPSASAWCVHQPSNV